MIDVPAFTAFCAELTIPSKEQGLVPLVLWDTQRYVLDRINAGLEDHVHQFVILKGRQLGLTTLFDAFRLFWPQTNSGTQGLFVSDDEDNRDYRRDVCLEMYASLPVGYKQDVRVNNRNLLAWLASEDYGGSRLMFQHSGMPRGGRQRSQLGRSRGINFLDADEVGSWLNPKDVDTVRASLAREYPRRLFLWNGTAQGATGPFQEMVNTAQQAVEQRFIFVGWYRHAGYRVPETNERVWARYGGRVTSDERLWMREVQRTEGVDIVPEQLVWYRQQLAEEFMGDEVMRAQEFPCIPEEAFQNFGDKFLAPHVIRRLHVEARQQPKPVGYRWIPGKTFDQTAAEECDPRRAQLLVWDQPLMGCAYIVALHAWGSSSPQAQQWVAQVWRVWPDFMAQVAEYTAEAGTTYGFAWLALYLAGAYRRSYLPWIINEIDGPGYAVAKEIQLMRDVGYGFSDTARAAGLNDVVGCFAHYFWARPDNLGWKSAPIDMKTTSFRLYMLHALADTVTRGNMLVRSPALIQSMAALRQGETGDADEVAGGGGSSDAHAMCAALAVRCWQDFAMPTLQGAIAPSEPTPQATRSVGEYIVGQKLDNLLRGRR